MSQIRSQKNQEKYSHDGFIYVKDRVSSIGDKIFWRCDLLNHGCKGRIHTASDNERTFLKLVTQHTCSTAGNAARVGVQKAVSAVRSRARESLEVLPSQIRASVVEQLPEAILGRMPNPSALRKVVQRARYVDRKPRIQKTSPPSDQMDYQYQPQPSEQFQNDFVLTDFNVVAEEQVPVFGLPKLLSGNVCIITGASEGIGASIAQSLAQETGVFAVLASRQVGLLEDTIKRLPTDRFFATKCDITSRTDVQELVRQTIHRFGRIDILINCAGAMYYTMAYKGYTEEWHRQIEVNVHGTTNIIGEIIPHMVEHHSGHILTITSDAGKRAFPGLAVYSGTKFYLEGFISALRQELVEYGIRFTNIQPGDVATKLASRSTDIEAREKYDGSEAGHKILSGDDVARSVLFALTQPQHAAINELLIEPQAAPI
uniref:NADP-dependent 3-hydroxy acid dehydrogenase YdfG n=1 Tax=Meloidogyne hapla TaxID=6305 RepID=A0A1I8BW55_MELHA